MFSTVFVPLYILLRFPKYLVLQDYFHFEDLSICCEKNGLNQKKKKKKKKKREREKKERILSCDWDTWCKQTDSDAWLGRGKELMTAYVMSSWWGAIFDKSHERVIIMGVIILYRRSYSMVLVVILWDIIKEVFIFVRAVSIFFRKEFLFL